MPIMEVQYPAPALDLARKAALAQRLTDAMIAMEGGANTTAGRAFAWVIFAPVGQDDWWVGGRLDDSLVAAPGKFLVRVTVPEGYMNAAQKSEVHAAVNAAISDVMGPANATSTNATSTGATSTGASIMVIIDEVTEGNWGAGGKSISLASMADKVGLPKDGERFAWVRSYFDAKARQRALAGYPSDTGGLLPAR